MPGERELVDIEAAQMKGQRAASHYRRELRTLTESVTVFLARLDTLMQEPSTVERGRRIAKLCNAMELINDQVRHRSLGINGQHMSRRRK